MRPPRRALIRIGTVWCLAAAIGWAVYRTGRLVGGTWFPSILWWYVGAGVAAAVGIMAGRRLGLLGSGSRERVLLLASGGWGLAMAAGWSLSVMVGGPLSGVVTLLALRANDPRVPLRESLVVSGATLIGLTLGWRAARGLPIPATFGVTVLGGLLPLLLLRQRAGSWLPWMAGWGVAWVGSWWATGFLPSGLGSRVVGSIEVALAFLVGGLVTAWVWRSWSRTRSRVAFAWAAGGALCAIAAAGLSIALEALYRAGTGGGAPPGLLDVAQTIGIAVAGAVGVSASEPEGGDVAPG